MRGSLILGFADYREPAQRLAAAAGMDYAEVQVHRFPDGESRLQLPATLPERVVLCRSLDQPNGKLVELELAAVTARELGARHLTLVAPYLCYMRQDSAFHPGEAVSQRIVGQWLARLVDAVITVDPHLHRTPHLRDAVPVHRALSLSAGPLLGQWLEGRPAAPLLLGPDSESAPWVKSIARLAGLDYGVASKERLGDREVRVTLPDLEVAGRDVVLVDDIASTGRTLAAAATQVLAKGARKVDVLVTHALFAGDALEILQAAGVGEVLSTDSVRHASNRVELAPLLAEALKTVAETD
ncbi:ribose-phosphate diphosphokinase [Haliea atlantica]